MPKKYTLEGKNALNRKKFKKKRLESLLYFKSYVLPTDSKGVNISINKTLQEFSLLT